MSDSPETATPETGHPDGEGFGEPLVEMAAEEPQTGPHIMAEPESAEQPQERLESLGQPLTAIQVGGQAIELNIGQSAPPTDLLARMYEMVEIACAKFAMRDQISYLVGSTVVPINPEQVMPVLSLTIAIPSLMIQQAMQGTVMIQDLFFDQTQIDGVVSDMLANLRNARIQQASNFGQPVN
jgi:hypothetical protein